MVGWALQVDGSFTTTQTPSFPVGAVVRKNSKQCAWEDPVALNALLHTNPWDQMWAGRATRLYFTDPAYLDDGCLDWLKVVLRFRYEFRQAAWDQLHWIHTGTKTAPKSMDKFIDNRNALNSIYLHAWMALLKLQPTTWPKFYKDTFWFEPALWYCPTQHCTWILVPAGRGYADDSGNTVIAGSLEEQLAQLDSEEPLRVQWAGNVSRFHEVVPAAHQPLVEYYADRDLSWELPVQHPDDTTVATLGSPGAAFYSLSGRPQWWNRAELALRRLSPTSTLQDLVSVLFVSDFEAP
jgi:hypothetical protein